MYKSKFKMEIVELFKYLLIEHPKYKDTTLLLDTQHDILNSIGSWTKEYYKLNELTIGELFNLATGNYVIEDDYVGKFLSNNKYHLVNINTLRGGILDIDTRLSLSKSQGYMLAIDDINKALGENIIDLIESKGEKSK